MTWALLIAACGVGFIVGALTAAACYERGYRRMDKRLEELIADHDTMVKENRALWDTIKRV